MNLVHPSSDSNPEIARELVEIWRRALNLSEVGPDDTFLSLGGDSLDAMHILMQVEERFGVELPNSALFEHPTITKLANAIGEISEQNRSTSALDSPRKAA